MIRGIALLFTTALLVAPGLPAAAQQARQADEWLTTGSRSALLTEQSPLEFSSPTNASPSVEVNDLQRFQPIDGFGFAVTGGSAQLLMRMDPAQRTALLKEIFGVGGSSIGASYIRVSIGSSDMNDHPFTYDDMPSGQRDPHLNKFDLGPDQSTVIPVLHEILAIRPDIKILGSPWSAPAWMKTNGSLKGGHLQPELYPVYAAYFVKYLQTMKANGITLDAITIQNEPLNPKNTPSMVMFAPEEAAFIGKALVPAFHNADLHTKILLYDHNPDVPSYPLSILADPAASPYVAGTAFHLYGGEASTFTKVHDDYPNKDLYMTEQSITSHPGGGLPIAESVSRVLIGATRNWSRNVLLWNLAADPNDGPHTNDGGCTGCQGAITLDGNTVTRNLAYYADAHFSKFVPPGSVRIGSSELDQLATAAFLTPAGRVILVASNTGNFPMAFNVKYHGQWFTTTLPEESVATYVW